MPSFVRGRRLSAIIGVILAVGMIGAACGARTVSGTSEPTVVSTTPPPPETSTTATAEPVTTTTEPPGPRFGGEAIVGTDQEPVTLNPYAPGGDNLVVSQIGQAIFARAWDIDGRTRQVVPDVLAEIPSVDNGGVMVNGDGTMEVRYVIRDEAVWSDGVPITGEDLAFTLDVIDTSGERSFQPILDTEVGDKTFTVTFVEPSFGYELPFEWIIPAHAVAGTDVLADWNEVPFLGAGPFVFESWTPGQAINLVRNPNYWKVGSDGKRLPYLDRLEFRIIGETDRLLEAFSNRELDVIQPPPGVEFHTRFRFDDPGIDHQVLPGPIWEHINFQFGPNNRNEDSLNANLDFRRAVAHAIGDSLDEVIPWWLPIDSFLDPVRPDLSSRAWERYDHDPDTARELLGRALSQEEKTTAKVIFSTTSNADERPRIAEALGDALEAVGIEYEMQLEDSQLFFGATLDNGTWDVGQWAWIADPTLVGLVSLLDLLDPNAPPPDGRNYYRWGTTDSSVRDESTKRFSEILSAARSTIDGDEVERLLVEAEQLLADQVVILPLWSRSDELAVWADEVAGVVHLPEARSFLWNVEDWYRVDG